MPNDINNLDSEDIGLKQIFGDRYHDETTEKPTTAKATPNTSNTTHCTETAQKPTKKPTKEVVDAEYQPEPNWLDNLKASVKSVAIYGGLNLLIFYWQQAELMDASIALPCMIVCATLAGWGVGRNFAKEYRR